MLVFDEFYHLWDDSFVYDLLDHCAVSPEQFTNTYHSFVLVDNIQAEEQLD